MEQPDLPFPVVTRYGNRIVTPMECTSWCRNTHALPGEGHLAMRYHPKASADLAAKDDVSWSERDLRGSSDRPGCRDTRYSLAQLSLTGKYTQHQRKSRLTLTSQGFWRKRLSARENRKVCNCKILSRTSFHSKFQWRILKENGKNNDIPYVSTLQSATLLCLCNQKTNKKQTQWS
jgi:hypothetical protein